MLFMLVFATTLATISREVTAVHPHTDIGPRTAAARRPGTGLFLLAGVLGGLMVTVISLLLAVIEPGFDIRRHANSLLVLGNWGWLQTLDFILYGVLLIVFAVGVWRVTRPRTSGTIAAVGVGCYGLFGGVVVGLNPAAPMFGFPPGARSDAPGFDELALAPKIHWVAGLIGFLGMTVACFAFARYFAAERSRGWAGASFTIGLAVVGVCGYLAKYAGAQVDSFDYVPTWVVGTALWLYVAAVAGKLYLRWRATPSAQP